MQLILSIDDIGIKKNMSTVKETNHNEKEINNVLENILSHSTTNSTDDSIGKPKKNVQDSLDSIHTSNGTSIVNDASEVVLDKSEEKCNDTCKIPNIENNTDVKLSIKTEVICDEDPLKEIKTENEDDVEHANNVNDCLEKEINCDENSDSDMNVEVKSEIENDDGCQIESIDESQKQDIDIEKENNEDEKQIYIDESQLEDFDIDSIENTTVENVESDLLEYNEHQDRNSSKDNGPPCSISEEIIDIADEKDSFDSIEDRGQTEKKFVENIPLDTDSSDVQILITEAKLVNNTENLEKSTQISVLDKTVETTKLDKSNHASIAENIQNKQIGNEVKEKASVPINNVEPSKKLFKLSNTLDILSDDDEDNNTTKPESPKPEPVPQTEANNKQCINIEDDDDIMLIVDESTMKENKTNNGEELKGETGEITNSTDQVENKEDVKEDSVKSLQNNDIGLDESLKEKEETKENAKPEEKLEKSSLLSPTALKTFKKNFADMTREELEDFCILKIVESVFDRSNLGEMKSQLKVLAQNMEEYKTKAKLLLKQNRDLQVILKSVQEEQKKNSGAAITPLKITRSVGMQVLMTDKNSRKRQGLLNSQGYQNPILNNPNTTGINNKNQNKNQVNQNTRNTKSQQQIPVPRLIPAVNMGTKTGPNASPQAVNNPGKSPIANNIPNGMKNPSPVAKPEKRSHSKMQQNNSSDTVDLTADEPPAKVNNRNFNSPVRCVPPQSLLTPQRAPLHQSLNSPKKVYIPISGPQSQNIRPGQTIMLKSVSSQVSRPRGPASNIKMGGSNPGTMRNARVAQRHPAPLPDFMKQYQPPNWKAIPPAPELKLTKVENGIVVSWKIDGYREENHEEIASYQLFAYQETSSPPNTSLWSKIGDVKALPLPMACTLTQFMSGNKYYFAVRAVDVRSRFGPFSLPGSILLLKNQ